MHHPSAPRQLLRRTALAVAAAVLVSTGAGATGCMANRRGPALPDISDPMSQVERRLARTERIREVMTRDLGRMATLYADLSEVPPPFFAPPFPRDLFRHVAMRCLNAISADASTQPPPSSRPPQQAMAPLSCAPRFLDRLVDTLRKQVPERTSRALTLLRDIDAFFRLRHTLRRRLTKTVEVVEETGDFLADHRAQLANRWNTLRERRTEYPPARYKKAEARLQTYRQTLDTLQKASSDLLTVAAEQWPRSITTLERKLYFTLTGPWGMPADESFLSPLSGIERSRLLIAQ